MASIVIDGWRWEASLEALADDAGAASEAALRKLSWLAERVEPLNELTIQSGNDGEPLIVATNHHEIHNLEVGLQNDWVGYRYTPAFAVTPETLLVHLAEVAEPILIALTDVRSRSGAKKGSWFRKHVMSTTITYDVTIETRGRPRNGAMAHLMDAFGPEMGRRAAILMKRLRPVAKAGPKEVGVKLTCPVDLRPTQSAALSIELFGADEPTISATILLLSDEEKEPVEPWFCNAAVLHRRLWPAIARFFDSLEEHGR
jgi:hypothetical protein